MIVEVKFWAELMPTQQNAYLKLLPLDGPAVVLFLVPDERVGTLWPELRKRAEFTGRLSEVDTEGKCVRVGDSHRYLMVTGWAHLLDCLETRTRNAEETQVAADVRQLRGLADYEIARGRFRPIDARHDAFGPGEGEGDRDRDLRRIIDSATDFSVDAGWLSKDGLNRVLRSYGYGRYVRFSGSSVLAWFGINYDLYERNGETPLWLWFYKPALKRGHLNHAQLDALRDQCGLRGQWVPLILKPGVEFSDVRDDVGNRLGRISLLLKNNRRGLGRRLTSWVSGRKSRSLSE